MFPYRCIPGTELLSLVRNKRKKPGRHKSKLYNMAEPNDPLPQGSPDSEPSPLAAQNISILDSASSTIRPRRNTPITSTAAYAWLNVQSHLEYYQMSATQNAVADLKIAPSKDVVGQMKIEAVKEVAGDGMTKIA
ncbi:hypothetical protein DTO271D3_4575 [Paecilomyces variotii]|nr:hypothetical protein DTO271D3_4575 [Paecilomyces variotii]